MNRVNDLIINIAVMGQTSVGKSTFMNTLFTNRYSNTKMIKTTMLPQVYTESEEKTLSTEHIRECNDIFNKGIKEKGKKITYEDIEEKHYNVPKISKFIKKPNDVYFSIYDIPGMDDIYRSELYLRYLKENCYKFDVIFYITAISHAFNSKSEGEFFTKIIKIIKENKEKWGVDTKLMILVNKCDDMYSDYGKLILDYEYQEVYTQIIETIKGLVKSSYPRINYTINKIALMDAFIYRMVLDKKSDQLDEKLINRFGANELGKRWWNAITMVRDKRTKFNELISNTNFTNALKLSGYTDFRMALNKQLDMDNQYIYLRNHISYDVNKIIEDLKKSTVYIKKDSRQDDITKFAECRERLIKLNTIYSHAKNLTDVKILIMVAWKTYMEIYKEKTNHSDHIKTNHQVTDNEITSLEPLKNWYKFCNKRFKEVWFWLSKDYDIILNRSNDYYIRKLQCNITSETAYKYIDILKENRGEWKDGISYHLINKKTSTDIKELYSIKKRYTLYDSELIPYIYIILFKKYKSMPRIKNKDFVDMFCVYEFWNKIIIPDREIQVVFDRLPATFLSMIGTFKLITSNKYTRYPYELSTIIDNSFLTKKKSIICTDLSIERGMMKIIDDYYNKIKSPTPYRRI